MSDFWGGGFGALANDFRRGSQIQRNRIVIQRCLQISGEQHSRIQMLLSRYDQDVREGRQRLHETDAQLRQAEQAIFAEARARAS